MKTIRTGLRRALPGLTAVLLAAGAAACDDLDDGINGPIDGGGLEPRAVEARYAWILQGWRGVQPVGQPAVEVTWELPDEWDGEPFRVYAKPANRTAYSRIATVTSCAAAGCRYTDVNVAGGQTYDYFVATELSPGGAEEPSPAVRAVVPQASTPQTPAAPTVTALDDALFLRWASTGAERYRVFVERVGSDSAFILIGETDGTAFLDERVDNGVAYAYRIAAVDTLGTVSARGALGSGTPRPDYHSEVIYAQGDSAAASGFRVQRSDDDNPVVTGDAAGAQWRLEVVGGVPTIRPLGSATVTRGQFTTALTCGPGSESDCTSIQQAPAASAFSAAPVAVEAGNTYVFRVTGDDGRTHYGKVRVQGATRDARGRTLAVFDWAYQLRPDVASLSR